MAKKPTITIDNFKGMKPSGAYFLQGFTPKIYGGQSVLSPTYKPEVYINPSDTNFTDLEELSGIAKTASGIDMYGIVDGNGKIYHFTNSLSGSGGFVASAHSATTTNADIIETEKGSLLFTSDKYLALGYKFTADSATSTSLTVNGETFFSTYGINISGDIYNIDKQEHYTITNSGPTDTLTFNAASTTPQANDEFLAFNDSVFTLNSSTTGGVRQITNFGNDYYITNYHYIAVLQDDETTFAAQEKKLPTATQATCISSNSDRILVGGNSRGKGKILTWDGESDFWNNTLDVPAPPDAITKYNDSFIIIAQGVLYQTDGYSIQKITELPDYEIGHSTGRSETPFNGLIIYKDKIYIVNEDYNLNRYRCGIYVYDLENKSFSYFPFPAKSYLDGYYGGQINGGAISVHPPYGEIYTGTELGITKINFDLTDDLDLGDIDDLYCAQFLVNLSSKMRLNKIELNLSIPNIATHSTGLSSDVIVAIGDLRKGMYHQVVTYDTSTSSRIDSYELTNYAKEYTKVNDQIEIIATNRTDTSACQKRFITSITDNGSTVEYGIDKNITTPPSTAGIAVISNLNKQGSKTITLDSDLDMLKDLTYPISDFNSDKLWLEILIRGNLALNINSINIY